MKYITYAIFLLIPFINQASVAEHILLVDIPVLMGSLLLPFSFKSRRQEIGVLDFLVIAYLVSNLLSVAVGIESLYESARYYRHMVLGPVLLYAVVRFSPLSLYQLRKAMFFMLPGIFFQGFLLIKYYLINHSRPVGVEGVSSIVTLSVLFCISLFILFWGNFKQMGVAKWVLRLILTIAFFAMLSVTYTRAAIISFVILLPFVHIIWTKKHLRKIFGAIVLTSIVTLFVLLVAGTIISTKPIKVENQKEVQRSASRLYEKNLYAKDLGERFAFWSTQTRRALQHPILGSGASSYKIEKGDLGGNKFQMASSHNILVSTLMTSGLVGICLLLLIIMTVFYSFNEFVADKNINSFGKILMASFTVMLMVCLTNDFTGGRILIWFLLLSLIAKIRAESQQMIKNRLNFN